MSEYAIEIGDGAPKEIGTVRYEVMRVEGLEVLCGVSGDGEYRPIAPVAICAPWLYRQLEFHKKCRMKQYGTPHAGMLPGHKYI